MQVPDWEGRNQPKSDREAWAVIIDAIKSTTGRGVGDLGIINSKLQQSSAIAGWGTTWIYGPGTRDFRPAGRKCREERALCQTISWIQRALQSQSRARASNAWPPREHGTAARWWTSKGPSPSWRSASQPAQAHRRQAYVESGAKWTAHEGYCHSAASTSRPSRLITQIWQNPRKREAGDHDPIPSRDNANHREYTEEWESGGNQWA